MTVQMLDAPDAPFRLTTPIDHITKLDDGTLVIHCLATSERLDGQGEIIDYDAAKAAAPDFLRWAALTEMHNGGTSPGTVLRLFFDDDHRQIEADLHVVDPVAVRKVLSRTFKAVSIGGVILATELIAMAGRTVRRITKLRWDELALVTRPANADALIAKQFVLAKRQETDMTDSIDAGTGSPLDDVPATDAPDHEARTPGQAAIDATRAALAKEAADENVGGGRVRSDIPKEDFVFPEDAPDGGFPITTAGDVPDAVSSWGRYKGPHSFAEFKQRLTAIARRKGFEGSLPASWKQVEKEARKMAKRAAQAAEQAATEAVVAKAEETPPAGGGEEAGAFPGAAPPFKSTKAARKKAARKARTKAKAERVAAFAKGNKTIKDLAEAYEAVMCAIQEEADEGDQDGVNALQAIADSIHECMAAEAAEPDVDDAFDPDLASAYAKSRKRVAKRAERLAKRFPRLRKRLGKLRKRDAGLQKKNGRLRKAAFFTKVLMKAGSRHNAADRAAIETIYRKAQDLGAPFTAPQAPDHEAVTDTGSTDSALAKSGTMMHEALTGVLPPDKVAAIEARLASIDERSKEQSETIAKIAKAGSGGGPTVLHEALRSGDGNGETKGHALAKAAEVIDDPRLKQEISSAAALEQIRSSRTGG